MAGWWHLAEAAGEGIVHPHWFSYAPLPYAFHVCVGVLMIFTALSSLLGNGLVLWSFFRFRSLRTSSNLFIVSLGLADILMSSVDFPLFAAASFLGYWPFGFHVCQVYGATTGIAGLVTINTLAAISYDRYTVVVRHVGQPVRYISKSLNLRMIVVIWLLSASWMVLPLAGWAHFTLEGIGTTCTFDYLTRTPLNVSFIIVLMVTNFAAPLLLILYSYARIFLSVSSVQRVLMDCSPQISIGTQRQRFRRQTEVKTAFSVLIIVSFFCLAWTPYVIVSLIGLFGDVSLVSPVVSALPCIFAKVATVSNPPLYSIGHPKFRKKIRYLVKSSFRRGSMHQTNSPQTTQDIPQPCLLPLAVVLEMEEAWEGDSRRKRRGTVWLRMQRSLQRTLGCEME
ncbi:rhodopsin-like [Babylonia areolata]|uniref:rhodopsin-like n=1 Tax=Babylonia areolata TaxID=304850 RepID=UPI003FD3A666